MNEMLKLCINQGYVPADCILDGMLVYLLVKDGHNPCCGCNRDCVHKARQYKEMAVDQKEKDKFERIEKRRRLNTNKEAVVYVETEKDQSNVTVMIPDEERGYVAHFKSADETSAYIPIICRMYGARQVFVEMNGYGIAVYDFLCGRADEIKNIDVVPIYNRAMRLN